MRVSRCCQHAAPHVKAIQVRVEDAAVVHIGVEADRQLLVVMAAQVNNVLDVDQRGLVTLKEDVLLPSLRGAWKVARCCRAERPDETEPLC